MKRNLLLIVVVLVVGIGFNAYNQESNTTAKSELSKISTRISELDQYWDKLGKTVQEGDFEGYKAMYHEDAVIIFAIGENKMSIPISTALAGWRQGFLDTEVGKVQSQVECRFSQRINDKTTAHETGIFHYSSKDGDGNYLANDYVHFEMLLVKRGGSWLSLMEYQKSKASLEEWKALK